jgi:hypothetical protein
MGAVGGGEEKEQASVRAGRRGGSCGRRGEKLMATCVARSPKAIYREFLTLDNPNSGLGLRYAKVFLRPDIYQPGIVFNILIADPISLIHPEPKAQHHSTAHCFGPGSRACSFRMC